MEAATVRESVPRLKQAAEKGKFCLLTRAARNRTRRFDHMQQHAGVSGPCRRGLPAGLLNPVVSLLLCYQCYHRVDDSLDLG
jgi:hypothetical protein